MEFRLTISGISSEYSEKDLAFYLYIQNTLLDVYTEIEPNDIEWFKYLEGTLKISVVDLVVEENSPGEAFIQMHQLKDRWENNSSTAQLQLHKNNQLQNTWIEVKYEFVESNSQPSEIETLKDNLSSAKRNLDFEKKRSENNTKLQEQLNVCELSRVSLLSKIEKLKVHYDSRIKELCDIIEKLREDLAESQTLKETDLVQKEKAKRQAIMTQHNKLANTYAQELESWKSRETQLIQQLKQTEDEKSKLHSEISNLKNKVTVLESENKYNESELKLQKLKNTQEDQEYLKTKIQDLETELSNLKFSYEEQTKLTHEAMKQLDYAHEFNNELQAECGLLESKLEEWVGDYSEEIVVREPSIEELLDNVTRSMTLPPQIEKVTDNIYRINKETVHLFVKNGMLYIEQGKKILLFNEWVKEGSKHTRSKSETLTEMSTVSEYSNDLYPVPEEEEYYQPPPKSTPRTGSVVASLCRTPPRLSLKSFRPILNRRK